MMDRACKGAGDAGEIGEHEGGGLIDIDRTWNDHTLSVKEHGNVGAAFAPTAEGGGCVGG